MKHAALLLLSAMLIISCSKTKIVTIPYSKQMAADYNFKNGSWWVYVDSITEHRDSIVIVSVTQQEEIEKDNSGKTEYHRQFLFYALQVYSEDSAGWRALPLSFDGFRLYDSAMALVLNNLTTVRDSANRVSASFRYPYTVNTPSVDLRGNTYTAVAQTVEYYGVQWHNQEAGFIKMPGLNLFGRSSTFELQKYSIVR